jgi:hypothetical protein
LVGEDEVVTYELADITKFNAETVYYKRLNKTYYYVPKAVLAEGDKSKEFIKLKNPEMAGDPTDKAFNFYIKTLSASLPVYMGRFVYE